MQIVTVMPVLTGGDVFSLVVIPLQRVCECQLLQRFLPLADARQHMSIHMRGVRHLFDCSSVLTTMFCRDSVMADTFVRVNEEVMSRKVVGITLQRCFIISNRPDAT